jgi:hypothetical protein
MSASAFSLTLAIPSEGFDVTAGKPVIGGAHGPTRHFFCPHCMSWMFTRPEGMDEFVNLRPSMLDDHNWFVPFIEVWTRGEAGLGKHACGAQLRDPARIRGLCQASRGVRATGRAPSLRRPTFGLSSRTGLVQAARSPASPLRRSRVADLVRRQEPERDALDPKRSVGVERCLTNTAMGSSTTKAEYVRQPWRTLAAVLRRPLY